MKTLILLATLFSGHLFADLPENDLWRYDNKNALSGVTETQFKEAIKEVSDVYSPIARALGFTLNIDGDWNDSTVNAYTSRNGSE